MSRNYLLLTTLKTRDAVAATAWYTLQHDMEMDGLVNLARKDLWQITFSEDDQADDEWKEKIRHLAEETRVFVNPNKHTWEGIAEDQLEVSEIQPGIYRIPVAVKGIENRRGIHALTTLRAMYEMDETVQNVEAGVLWIMDIRAASREEALTLADAIVTTRGRRQGLLANPHYERPFIYNR